jgi:FkbM family methyltransferase
MFLNLKGSGEFGVTSMNAVSITMRSYARKLGLIRLINFFRIRILGRSQIYEERFSTAMLSSIRHGDVVWDVGANLGLYTARFLERVGQDGQVVAFEPAPMCFRALASKFSGLSAVCLENAAMGAHEGKALMHLERDPLAPTHQILDANQNHGLRTTEAAEVIEVPIISGDTYWKKISRTPNIIKIDVEGFEEQVLHGMSALLKSPDLRAIFCEVHFALLEKRGEKMAPARIQSLLEDNGFGTRWIDASHLQAMRG